MSSPFLFSYPSLQSEDDIRLFTLLPGNFNDDLRILLQPVCLGSNVTPYQALSYTWGVERTHSITCEGGTIETPANLALALRYIRSETESQVLWADAICIVSYRTTLYSSEIWPVRLIDRLLRTKRIFKNVIVKSASWARCTKIRHAC